MKPPPLVTIAVLAWWGWQTHLLPAGIGMGLLLEGARHLPRRWALDLDDFRRLWNVTILLFIGAGLYLFFSQQGWGAVTDMVRNPALGPESIRTATRITLRFLQWVPILFFPFAFAHACSEADWLPWSAVSPLLHRRQKRLGFDPATRAGRRGFHPAYPYLAAVLFAASASDRSPEWYVLVLALLLAWLLWNQRSPRFAVTVWVVMFLLVFSMALAGREGLRWAYRQALNLESRLLSQFTTSQFDAAGSITDIGAVSRRKTSGKIVLRVDPSGDRPPELLREAVYTQFRTPAWIAPQREFQPVLPSADQLIWRLTQAQSPSHRVKITRYARRNQSALALPDSTFELRHLPAGSVETNRLTTARALATAPLVSYIALYADHGGYDSPPDPADVDLLHLQTNDFQAVLRAARELGISRANQRVAVDLIRTHLLSNFQYSLGSSSDEATTNTSPLAAFLFEKRRGHCEYFASATVLLLRAANVPARYVVGYSVQEKQGDGFVVRSRHGHAWALAFIDNDWRSIDNTPGGWVDQEATQASAWEPVNDWLSLLWLRFNRWRYGESQWRLLAFLLGIALLGFMAWRELRGGRWRRGLGIARTQTPRGTWPGTDSEFYLVQKALERKGLPRRTGEPWTMWLRGQGRFSVDQRGTMERLLSLHYRLRFHPAGLSNSERDELRTRVKAFLDQLH